MASATEDWEPRRRIANRRCYVKRVTKVGVKQISVRLKVGVK